jgi:hypothetical protein
MIAPRTMLTSILAGGPILGLLIGAIVNPVMKPGPDSPWRTAAREAALQVDSYTFADSYPSDLSPGLPWLNAMGARAAAPLPEDFYRARFASLVPERYEPAPEPRYEPEPLPSAEPRIAAEAERIADYIDQPAQPPRSALTGEIIQPEGDEEPAAPLPDSAGSELGG